MSGGNRRSRGDDGAEATPARPTARARPRPQPERSSAPSYPSLEAYLASRRSFLTWAGASLFTAAASVCCSMGDDDNGGGYYRIRIPDTGDLAVTLSGGGAVRCYVNLVCYSDFTFHTIDDADCQERCRQVLASHTYAELSEAVAQGIGAPPYGAIETELATTLLGADNLTTCTLDLVVTLTILALTA